MVDHRHHLASDKWENVLELAVHHMEPVFPLLNPFKISETTYGTPLFFKLTRNA